MTAIGSIYPLLNVRAKKMGSIFIDQYRFPSGGDITTGLTSWWKFDEGSGSTAVDSSSGGNTGTIFNSPTYVAGMIGTNALSFTGASSQYVIGANVYNYPVVTLAAWVKVASYSSTLVIGFANGIGSGTADKLLFLDGSGVPGFYVYDGSGKNAFGSTPIGLNTWRHLVATADGTNLFLYVDSVQVGTAAAGNTYTGYSVPNVIAAGATSGGPSPGYFTGQMDDVRVYNRALSAADVATLYAYR